MTISCMTAYGACMCCDFGCVSKLFVTDFFKQGFQRVFDSFADIQLDIPHAHTLLEKFTDMCARDGIIPISLTLKVPSRYLW